MTKTLSVCAKTLFLLTPVLLGQISTNLFAAGPSAGGANVVTITSHDRSPAKTQPVDNMQEVRGTIKPATAVSDLRVLTRPAAGGRPGCYTNKRWYPQDGLQTNAATGTWHIWVKLGEDKDEDRGCNHEVIAATFDAAGLRRIDKYFRIGRESGQWHPISLPTVTSNRELIRLQRKP